ncbi:hypothetical protein FOA52_013463 [Chlamydomonas sp. UWO 241]|nr:hypothetical protein FOA52_013463 [Chlamydomonas sp. UWO 241]
MRAMRAPLGGRCASARVHAALPASLALAPDSTRRYIKKAMVHLASSTPAQFSAFYGSKMMLPQCYVRRARNMVAKRMPAQMSFLGVGAPEALLVGVVALVVFGPKGLADAAKSLGTAVRSFQPAIKEVVGVSQELKATLDRELGLDELREAARPQPRVMPPGPAREMMDPDIEAKRAEAAKMAWGSDFNQDGTLKVPQPLPTITAVLPPAAQEPAPMAAAGGADKKDLSAMSMEDLEAELTRRKAAKQ